MAKEFDFDELDKAVNSLMKDTEPAPEAPAPVATPGAPVVELPAPAPVVEPVAPVASVSAPAEAVAPSPSPAVSKPTGRFMDVVHPSSDMRTPSQSVPREGVPVAPIAPATPEINSPAPVPSISTEPEPALDSVTLPPAPLASPFLPDAQVEKRPLGGPSPEPTPSLDEAIAAELSADAEPASIEATEPTTIAETEPAASPEPTVESTAEPTASPERDTPTENEKDNNNVGLPAELSNDLVAIESGEAQPGESDQLETPATTEDTGDTTPSPATAMLSQSSIPQQYKEEASSTTETHAPIYDDQTSAQAIPQAKKKGNTTRIILIAVIAVVVGVVGAAALYYLQFSR